MAETIRILHILQRMEAGGTQALLMNIYRNLDRKKVQFDFLVEYPNKEFYDDEIKSLGGKVYYTNVRNDYNLFKFQQTLKKIILDNQYKIVHVHTYSIGYFCLKTAKECNVKVRIAHSHSNQTVKDIKYFPKLVLQRLYTLYATDLFACSNEAGKYLFKGKKFNVIKNAIDTDKFVFDEKIRKKIRDELNLSNQIVIGNVGRLHEQKNQLFLLEIFLCFKRKKENIKLIIIGNGPLESKLKEKAKKLNLENDVIFMGNRRDVNEVYQAMDLLLFPSLFEGLGIVAIEAQTSALPVLCSTNLPEEVEITPYLEKMSLDEPAENWANKAIEMLQKYKNMREDRKKDIVKAGFDIKDISIKMQEYYLKKYYEE